MSTNFLGGGVVLDDAGRPLDQIVLTGVSATGYHGVFPHERREGQVFLADVVVHLDTRRAAATDDLARTVNYGDLADAVAGVLSGEPADLVETVAERIAATALADPAIAAVDVAVHKPQAPIGVPFDDVVVRIHRDRHKLPAAEPWRRPAEPVRRDASGPDGREPDVEAGPPAPAPAAPPTAAPPTAVPVAAVPADVPDAAAPAGPSPDVPAPAPDERQRVPSDRLDEEPPEPVEAVLALGANLGTPQSTLREAVADIERIPGVEILAVSPLARTAPVGGPGQPDFLNAVVVVRTSLSARALLHAAQAVEQQHGRVRTEHWGPRTLDVDLITYGSTLAVTDDLELPHPRAHQRAFVLAPWAQVAPDAVLPGLGGGPVAVLAATAPDRDGVRWMALDWMTAPLPRGAVRDEPGDDDAVPAGVPGDAALADAHGERPDGVPPTDDPEEEPEEDEPVDHEPQEDEPVDHEPQDDGPVGRGSGTAAPVPGAAPASGTSSARDPLDWLPELPVRSTPPTTGPGAAGPRTPIFSPVVPPDDARRPEDRRS